MYIVSPEDKRTCIIIRWGIERATQEAKNSHQLCCLIVCAHVWAQLCTTLCDPIDCSLPGSSVHGIFQTRILKWVAISYSRGSLQSRDRTCISCIFCIGRWILHHCATWEDPFLSQLMATPFFWLPRIYRVTLGSSLFSHSPPSIL